MSNNTFSSSPVDLTKEQVEGIKEFERAFLPAGGQASSNIPQAPPAPTHINNLRTKPIQFKTRNWGNKGENGYTGLNRSLYDRPDVFYWDSNRPSMSAPVASNNNNNLSSFPPSSSSSSSSSVSSTSRSVPSSIYSDNIPPAPAIHKKFYKSHHHSKVHGKHLRLHNWGQPTENGWSGMNRELYNSGMTLERDILLNELRYKYGPRPSAYQEREFVETVVPIQPQQTFLVATGPAKVLATTVPVPMLNPPINDGRRYAKLYAQNTNAMASGKGISKLVKRRGTRRDHLVQPTTTGLPITTTTASALPYTVVQPATLVAETRSIGTALPLVGAPTTVLPTPAPATAGLSRKERKKQNKALKDQQRFVKREQREARKASKRNPSNLGLPVAGLPLATPSIPLGAPILPATTSIPLSSAPILLPATTTVLPAATTTRALPIVAPSTTLVGSPMLLPPITSGVSNQPLDHSKVLAGQLGNAPVKRPRRARKAKKGTEQPLYSNIISSTPAPLAATTLSGLPTTTSSSFVETGTTVVQPLTLVSETRNVLPTTMIKEELPIMTAPINPLAMGNPIM